MDGRAPKAAEVLLPAPLPTLCLDFANTRSWRGREAPTDTLRDLHAVLAWSGAKAGFGTDALDAIHGWAATHADRASALFAKAIFLRETVFRVFESAAHGKRPADRDFAALSTAIAAAPARARLARKDGGYAWSIPAPAPEAAQLFAPVLWSAADLLLGAGQHRIRQCANEKCLWLFVDESKSGTRRWCDMTSCGNRAKARRHYAKVKGA